MQVDISTLFNSFSGLHVLVVGDVMLDTYWWGKVDRISPEAPVPVVAVSKKEMRIGGAGNVALNIVSMGAKVNLLSVIGKDEDGEQLMALLRDRSIGSEYMVHSEHRITSNKIRIISRNQHMMRLDAEMTEDLSPAEEDKLLYAFENCLAADTPQVVILEDYNKGTLTPKVIEKIISLCKHHGILTAVDPKRKNFFAYRGVDIFKPNLKETIEGLNIHPDQVNLHSLQDMHIQLQEKLEHKISLITLSEKGVFYQQDQNAALIPTHIRNVADVSGAGDTVIAVASLVYAASKDIRLMAEVANIAGGLVCEEVGTVAIDGEKLMAECELLLK